MLNFRAMYTKILPFVCKKNWGAFAIMLLTFFELPHQYLPYFQIPLHVFSSLAIKELINWLLSYGCSEQLGPLILKEFESKLWSGCTLSTAVFHTKNLGWIRKIEILQIKPHLQHYLEMCSWPKELSSRHYLQWALLSACTSF